MTKQTKKKTTKKTVPNTVENDEIITPVESDINSVEYLAPIRVNPLVTIGTAETTHDVAYMDAKVAYFFEGLLYNHLKRVNVPVWAVKYTGHVPVSQLEKTKYCDLYNDYVDDAKALGEGYHGLQMYFDVDESALNGK